jgi:TonB family protein
MAPILKEADASVSSATATPATPHSKSASDSATRPQPVALEIPVTVNGARTIDGSDKRVPFSESTQTVLVFPHGAVVRIATPLAAGQLVFLTNEKSKKEVVCQVVKSKSTGSAAAYVELQFTEASAGFWGLAVPAPGAPRPGPVPVAPKATAPSTPASVNPPAAPKPAAPSVISAPTAKPVVPSVPSVSNTKPVSSTVPAPPPIVVAPSIPVPPVGQDPTHMAPSAPADSAPHVAPTPHQSTVPPPAAVPPPTDHLAAPVSPLHDYSKQIEALFAKPQAPSAPAIPESHHTPAVPSTDELKQQAARLQEQLSSLLFAETHPAPAGSSTLQSSATEVASKVAHEEPKAASTERKPASPILTGDEEVKIPSWLAPLSQNAEAAVTTDSAEKSAASHDASAVVTPEESHEALEAGASHPQTVVIGGQLLGESPGSPAGAASSSSKKLLLIGIAAAVLLAGGAWYFYPGQPASTVATKPATNTAPALASVPATNSGPASSTSAAPANNTISSSASVTQPAKKTPSSAPSTTEVQPRENRPAPKSPEVVEEAPKPALGVVHLAAPVVSHSSNLQSDSPALPSMETDSVPGAGDPLAAAEARHNAPAAPLPIGGEVQQARLIKSVPPQYPAIAKAQRISGKVQIDALIDKSGNVANAKVISGPPLLYSAAVDAVKQWKYSPALLDGEPTALHLTVTVEFRAQ